MEYDKLRGILEYEKLRDNKKIEIAIRNLFGNIVKEVKVCDPYPLEEKPSDDDILHNREKPSAGVSCNSNNDGLVFERLVITVKFINGNIVNFYGDIAFMYPGSEEDIF